jgi:hypothetical protein
LKTKIENEFLAQFSSCKQNKPPCFAHGDKIKEPKKRSEDKGKRRRGRRERIELEKGVL